MSEAYDKGVADTAKAIAYRIRAELVCCHIYDEIANTKAAEHVDETGHAICFWGEAGARIAESHSS